MNARIVMLGLLLLAVALLGCASTSRDLLTASRPLHGKFHQKSSDGKIIQETVWNHGKLVSCWEISRTSRWVNGRLEIAEPKWTQTVSDGSGRRTLFDKQGEAAGHEDFTNGEYTGGAG